MTENPEGRKTNRRRSHARRGRRLDRAVREWERTFDAVPDLIAIIDPQHRILRANRAMAARLGTTPKQCVGSTWCGYIHGVDAPPGYCPHELTMADGREHTVEVYEKQLGGYFLISCTPLFDEDGRILGTVHIARDITQRKHMEEDLRRSESTLAQASRMANLGAWEIEISNHEDLNQNPLHWSDQVYRIFGYEPRAVAVTNELFFRHVHPDDRQRVAEAVARGFARRQPYEVEHRIVRTDGTERIVLEHADIRFDEQGRPVQMIGAVQDITERTQVEESLRQLKEQAERAAHESAWLARIPQENPDPIIRVSADGVVLYGNPAAEDLYRWWGSGTGQKVPAPVQEAVSAAFADQSVLRREVACDSRILALIVAPLPTEGYATLYATDVTERRQPQRALQESEARLRAMMDVLPVGVFLTDTEGRILSANPAAHAIWGGQTPMTHLPPTCADQRGWWVDSGRWVQPQEWALASALRGGATCGPREIEIACLDGTHKVIVDYATPIRDEGGQIVGAVAVQMDITARRQAENTLRESEERFRRAIENASGAVVIANLEGAITYANPAFLRLVGYTEQELQAGALRWDRITPPEYASVDAEAVQELRQTGVAHPREKECLTKDGRRVPILMSRAITGYGPEGEPQVVVFVTDITARKQIEAELRRWNDQLEQQVQARTEELRESVDRLNEEVARRIVAEEGLRKRSEMLEERAWQLQQLTLELSQAEDRERQRLAEILHDDLQQLLAAAKFHVGLLNSRIASDDGARALAATITDLLKEAIGKSRNLSHELSPPTLSHNDLHESLEWLAQQVQTKHGLTVDLETFDRVELHSEPLKAFLYKAAQEMLFNVVKHAQVKEARLRLRRTNGHIYLSVTDKGRGFNPHLAGKAGFGLLSIQERVKLLGGRLKVHSSDGRGSIFVLAVPDPEPSQADERPVGADSCIRSSADCPEEKQDAREGPPVREEGRHGGPPLRVLLVDDHKIVRQGIKAMLAEAPDLEVVGEAGNGREAVNLASELVPDVIVMDMAMPVMAGDEATRQIKQHLPNTRIIALSMFDDSRVANRMRQAGAAAYLLKTAPAEELIAALRGSQAVTQGP